MSRSAETRPSRRGCLALTLSLGCLLTPSVAAAAPEPGGSVLDVRTPAFGLVAPVLDLATSTSDLGRAARVEQLPSKVTVTLDATVLFGKDSAKIRPAAAGRLAEIATELQTRGPGAVRIVGYTDDLGSAAHGLDLSRRRARAVAAVLRPHLPASSYRFTVLGRGEADPAVPNTSEKNRRINRRVVVTYQPA